MLWYVLLYDEWEFLKLFVIVWDLNVMVWDLNVLVCYGYVVKDMFKFFFLFNVCCMNLCFEYV